MYRYLFLLIFFCFSFSGLNNDAWTASNNYFNDEGYEIEFVDDENKNEEDENEEITETHKRHNSEPLSVDYGVKKNETNINTRQNSEVVSNISPILFSPKTFNANFVVGAGAGMFNSDKIGLKGQFGAMFFVGAKITYNYSKNLKFFVFPELAYEYNNIKKNALYSIVLNREYNAGDTNKGHFAENENWFVKGKWNEVSDLLNNINKISETEIKIEKTKEEYLKDFRENSEKEITDLESGKTDLENRQTDLENSQKVITKYVDSIQSLKTDTEKLNSYTYGYYKGYWVDQYVKSLYDDNVYLINHDEEIDESYKTSTIDSLKALYDNFLNTINIRTDFFKSTTDRGVEGFSGLYDGFEQFDNTFKTEDPDTGSGSSDSGSGESGSEGSGSSDSGSGESGSEGSGSSDSGSSDSGNTDPYPDVNNGIILEYISYLAGKKTTVTDWNFKSPDDLSEFLNTYIDSNESLSDKQKEFLRNFHNKYNEAIKNALSEILNAFYIITDAYLEEAHEKLKEANEKLKEASEELINSANNIINKQKELITGLKSIMITMKKDFNDIVFFNASLSSSISHMLSYSTKFGFTVWRISPYVKISLGSMLTNNQISVNMNVFRGVLINPSVEDNSEGGYYDYYYLGSLQQTRTVRKMSFMYGAGVGLSFKIKDYFDIFFEYNYKHSSYAIKEKFEVFDSDIPLSFSQTFNLHSFTLGISINF